MINPIFLPCSNVDVSRSQLWCKLMVKTRNIIPNCDKLSFKWIIPGEYWRYWCLGLFLSACVPFGFITSAVGPPPSIPDPSLCSAAQVFPHAALPRFLSVIRHASERAAAPARASSPRRARPARQTAARPDSLLLSAGGPGVTVSPGNRSPGPPPYRDKNRQQTPPPSPPPSLQAFH